MRKEIEQLVKHSGIYGLGTILSKSVGFLMIPVYTHYLLPADYGVLELLDMVIYLATYFAAMGIYGAVFRFYAVYDSEKEKREVISTALFYTAATSLLFALGIASLASPIAGLVLGKTSFAPFVRIVAATFLFSNLNEVPMAYWRAQGKTSLFVTVGLARTILGASTLAFFLAGLHWGVRGSLYANLVTNGISGLTLSGVVLSAVPWRIAGQRLEEMLRYGLPTVAWGISAFLLTFSDRLFLRYFSNLSDVGVYALGYKLGAIVAVIVSGPFAMAWGWQQFELAKRENGKKIFARTQTYLLMASVFVGLSVSVMARDILRILAPPAYSAAAYYVPIITLTYILGSMREFVISGIYIQRATIHLASISAVTVASNLALNYFLISRYHAMGAAVATVLSFAIELALCFIAAQRVYPIQYEYGRSAIILGSAFVIYLVSLLSNLEIVASVGVNSVLLIIFAGTVLTFLNSSERRALRQYVLDFAQLARLLTVRS